MLLDYMYDWVLDACNFIEACLMGFAMATVLLLAIRFAAGGKLLHLIQHHDYASVPIAIGAGLCIPVLSVWGLFLSRRFIIQRLMAPTLNFGTMLPGRNGIVIWVGHWQPCALASCFGSSAFAAPLLVEVL